jgi:hypothetical protein
VVATRFATLINAADCFVAPQYVLWRIRQPGEVSKKKEDHGVIVDQLDSDVDMLDDGEGDDCEIAAIGDRSFGSIASTIVVKDRKRITDFAVLIWDIEHTQGGTEQEPLGSMTFSLLHEGDRGY